MELEILAVLGSPNSPSGELSDISKSRLDFCAKIFSGKQLILLTGGWGAHFNTSDKPHAFYGKRYLINHGLSASVFVDFALSENTVDDAVKIKSILKDLKPKKINLSIVTSDYHVERVTIIFSEILKGYKMEFFGAKCELDYKALQILKEHENRAIAQIKRNGLYF